MLFQNIQIQALQSLTDSSKVHPMKVSTEMQTVHFNKHFQSLKTPLAHVCALPIGTPLCKYPGKFGNFVILTKFEYANESC